MASCFSNVEADVESVADCPSAGSLRRVVNEIPFVISVPWHQAFVSMSTTSPGCENGSHFASWVYLLSDAPKFADIIDLAYN